MKGRFLAILIVGIATLDRFLLSEHFQTSQVFSGACDRTSSSAITPLSLQQDIIVSINNKTLKHASDFQKLASNVKNRLEVIIDRQDEQIRIFYHF